MLGLIPWWWWCSHTFKPINFSLFFQIGNISWNVKSMRHYTAYMEHVCFFIPSCCCLFFCIVNVPREKKQTLIMNLLPNRPLITPFFIAFHLPGDVCALLALLADDASVHTANNNVKKNRPNRCYLIIRLGPLAQRRHNITKFFYALAMFSG
jgi:Na+/proline symporter